MLLVLIWISPSLALFFHLYGSSPLLFTLYFPSSYNISWSHPWRVICASLWKQAPLLPAGCTSLFLFSFCLVFILFFLRQLSLFAGVSEERSGHAGSWGKGFNMQAQDTGQGSSFQWGPSEFWIVQGKSTRLPCCQPQQPCQWTPQPWRWSSLLSPLCILSAGGWHRVIATCPSSICSIQSSHQPTLKYRGDRLLRRAARVEASALSLLANSLFLKHISSCACYSSALLLKMSSSNINHESDESIYSRQACIGGNRVKERKKIDRCVL